MKFFQLLCFNIFLTSRIVKASREGKHAQQLCSQKSLLETNKQAKGTRPAKEKKLLETENIGIDNMDIIANGSSNSDSSQACVHKATELKEDLSALINDNLDDCSDSQKSIPQYYNLWTSTEIRTLSIADSSRNDCNVKDQSQHFKIDDSREYKDGKKIYTIKTIFQEKEEECESGFVKTMIETDISNNIEQSVNKNIPPGTKQEIPLIEFIESTQLKKEAQKSLKEYKKEKKRQMQANDQNSTLTNNENNNQDKIISIVNDSAASLPTTLMAVPQNVRIGGGPKLIPIERNLNHSVDYTIKYPKSIKSSGKIVTAIEIKGRKPKKKSNHQLKQTTIRTKKISDHVYDKDLNDRIAKQEDKKARALLEEQAERSRLRQLKEDAAKMEMKKNTATNIPLSTEQVNESSKNPTDEVEQQSYHSFSSVQCQNCCIDGVRISMIETYKKINNKIIEDQHKLTSNSSLEPLIISSLKNIRKLYDTSIGELIIGCKTSLITNSTPELRDNMKFHNFIVNFGATVGDFGKAIDKTIEIAFEYKGILRKKIIYYYCIIPNYKRYRNFQNRKQKDIEVFETDDFNKQKANLMSIFQNKEELLDKIVVDYLTCNTDLTNYFSHSYLFFLYAYKFSIDSCINIKTNKIALPPINEHVFVVKRSEFESYDFLNNKVIENKVLNEIYSCIFNEKNRDINPHLSSCLQDDLKAKKNSCATSSSTKLMFYVIPNSGTLKMKIVTEQQLFFYFIQIYFIFEKDETLKYYTKPSNIAFFYEAAKILSNKDLYKRIVFLQEEGNEPVFDIHVIEFYPCPNASHITENYQTILNDFCLLVINMIDISLKNESFTEPIPFTSEDIPSTSKPVTSTSETVPSTSSTGTKPKTGKGSKKRI